MTPQLVLDAWAVLAFLQKEKSAADRVKQLLTAAEQNDIRLSISIINLGEVIYRIGKVKGEAQARETLDTIYLLPLQVVSVNDEAVFAAVRFKMRYPISYADAFAVALAERLDAVLVTGDPELLDLKHQIRLEPLKRN